MNTETPTHKPTHIPIDVVKRFDFVTVILFKITVQMRLPLFGCDTLANECVNIVFDVWQEYIQATQSLF